VPQCKACRLDLFDMTARLEGIDAALWKASPLKTHGRRIGAAPHHRDTFASTRRVASREPRGHGSGNVWNVHDGNSGGRVTREHARSIAGYTVVDPSAGSHRFVSSRFMRCLLFRVLEGCGSGPSRPGPQLFLPPSALKPHRRCVRAAQQHRQPLAFTRRVAP